MKLQFNAFIPGFLGMPLETLVAFNCNRKLENEESFYRDVARAGRRGGVFRTWITEPFNTNTFCSTDTRNFGEHNIATEGYDTQKSRLYLFTPNTMINGIDLSCIGKMSQKYYGEIFKKRCGASHRVAVNYSPQYQNELNRPSSNSPRVYTQKSNMGCHYGHYRAPLYGTVYEFAPKASNPSNSTFTYPDQIYDFDKNHSCIKTGAQAGYPYAEPFSPNIDFDIVIDMYRFEKVYKVEITGTHNQFPYYEMLIDGQLVYQYNACDFGPSIVNLNASKNFSYTKYFPNAQKITNSASIIK